MTTASATKRKVSVSLDADLLAAIETSGESLSAQINEALREEVARRQRRVRLRRLLDDLETRHGPPDEELVRKYEELLA